MTEQGNAYDSAFRRETERIVNEIAQELRTLDDGTAWFSSLSPARRQGVLQEVAGYAMQAVFAVADTRRRQTSCKGTCGHAWHNLTAGEEQS
ncbi:DUF5958 family protein [Streptomyces sp. NPDC046876]|uniref:DUF5958 family protein n=1 Tax=Streptomyces sp. NPDC046876 TaxID=3155616 RepID=UPI0033E2E51E